MTAPTATQPGRVIGAAGAPGTPAGVRVRELTKRFADHAVLRGLDLDIAPGEIVALVGQSGCGKSTLLRVLAGLSQDHTGEVSVPAERSVAFQEARLFPWQRTLANVALGVPAGTLPRREAERRAGEVLGEVGLSHRLDAWPLTLSGGEAQRAALARALVAAPKLLLLDEPFGALDALTRITAQDLLLQLWSRHRFSVLLVTHDVNEAVALADRVLVMDSGRLSHEVRIDLPRPREHRSPEAARLAGQLLDLLGLGR